jgi:hypothetical protein
MPLHPFDGQTFVAFLAISGFKELMKQIDKALKALNLLVGLTFPYPLQRQALNHKYRNS